MGNNHGAKNGVGSHAPLVPRFLPAFTPAHGARGGAVEQDPLS